MLQFVIISLLVVLSAASEAPEGAKRAPKMFGQYVIDANAGSVSFNETSIINFVTLTAGLLIFSMLLFPLLSSVFETLQSRSDPLSEKSPYDHSNYYGAINGQEESKPSLLAPLINLFNQAMRKYGRDDEQ